MTLKQPGPELNRPNTLRDQMEPNTFRASGTAESRAATSSSPSIASPVSLTNLRIPGWLIRVAISFVIVIAVYLLLSTS